MKNFIFPPLKIVRAYLLIIDLTQFAGGHKLSTQNTIDFRQDISFDELHTSPPPKSGKDDIKATTRYSSTIYSDVEGQKTEEKGIRVRVRVG